MIWKEFTTINKRRKNIWPDANLAIDRLIYNFILEEILKYGGGKIENMEQVSS